MIRTVLVGFDGVIVDIELPTYTAWRDTYAEFGRPRGAVPGELVQSIATS